MFCVYVSAGITVVLGGQVGSTSYLCSCISLQYFSWNVGLSAGFGSYIIATLLVGFAYYALVLSLAEMASCLQVPFAGALNPCNCGVLSASQLGGSFFFARATIGRLSGFCVGCCEAMEYIAYVSATVIVFGQMVTYITGVKSRFPCCVC